MNELIIKEYQLPTVTEEAIDLFGGEETLNDEMPSKLPKITIDHKKQAFYMPSDEVKKTFQAIILYTRKLNSYWDKSIEECEGGEPPTCSSINGKYQTHCRGEALNNDENVNLPLCSDCPENKFGSGKNGKGKACRNTENLYLVIPGHSVPVLLVAPATSINAIRGLFDLMKFNRIRYQQALVTVSLVKKDNYSVLSFKIDEITRDRETLVFFNNMYKQFLPLMSGEKIELENDLPF